jgi:hypothetical protein
VWVVGTIAGLAVELTAIVLLGRSATRRDEDTAAVLVRGAAEPLVDRGRLRISGELPDAVGGDRAVRGSCASPGRRLRLRGGVERRAPRRA